MRRKFLLYLIILLIGPAVAFGQVSKQAAAIPKISFDFLDADLKNVLRVLSEVSKKNIVIAEDVKGKVTIKLDNVSFDEALDAILKNYELAKIEDENILRIVPSKKYYDERDRVEFLKEKEARQKLEEEFITETVFINYADAQDVEKMIRGEESKDKKIRGLLSANGAVTMVKWTNALIIKDTRDNVQEITKRIKEHDVPPIQIQIEARIVQASTDFSKELGIQWGGSYQTRVGGRNVDLSGMKQVTGTSAQTEYTAATENLGIRNNTVAFPYNLNLPAAMGAGRLRL
jgi:type II secretory pathway component HofQ